MVDHVVVVVAGVGFGVGVVSMLVSMSMPLLCVDGRSVGPGAVVVDVYWVIVVALVAADWSHRLCVTLLRFFTCLARLKYRNQKASIACRSSTNNVKTQK